MRQLDISEQPTVNRYKHKRMGNRWATVDTEDNDRVIYDYHLRRAAMRTARRMNRRLEEDRSYRFD